LDLGVEFHFNQKVEKIMIENKTAKGVKVNGALHLSDVVVSNADIMHAYNQLMPEVKKPTLYLNQEKSTSALVFYWGIKKQYSQLDLHNIFFSNKYEKEFNYLKEGKVLDDPTIYLYVSSKFNKEDAPDGCENWFVMINVPSNTSQDWNTIVKAAKQNILNKLNKDLEVDVSKNIITEEILTPLDIEKRTSSFGGALYGNSSNNMFSAFLRHPNKRNAIKNLYFVSGSGHPGGGIPLCILSSDIATQHITHDKLNL
jgi:phytoene dehydrogenase-like protein